MTDLARPQPSAATPDGAPGDTVPPTPEPRQLLGIGWVAVVLLAMRVLALAYLLLSHQERDGSWFDFPFYNYHQQYGTAFGLLSLEHCRHE